MGSKHPRILLRLIFSAVLLIVVQSVITAQEYAFDKLTTENGLPENYVNCIHQDSRGFIWIGTNDGLCRYDGYGFKVYNIDRNKANWLQSNLIYNISEDNEGNLWIATSDNGVFRYDLIRDSFEHFGNTAESKPLLHNNIIAVRRFGDELLVGTKRGLNIISLDPAAGESTSYPGLSDIASSNQILSIEQQNNEKVWIGTRNGLFRYGFDSEGNRRLKSYPKEGIIDVMDIIMYGEGILIAAIDGIYYFDEKQGYQLVNQITANRLLLDREGNLWVGSYDGLTILKADKSGAMNFKRTAKIIDGWEIHNISSSEITSLYEDRFGSIWIGTKSGINKYNPYRKKFVHYRRSSNPGSISNNIIRTVYEDSKNNIWFGTEGGGISFLPYERAQNKAFNNLIHIPVNQEGRLNAAYCIKEVEIAGEPYYIVGTGFPDKLSFFQLKNNRPVRSEMPESFDQIPNMVFDIEDDSNFVWLGTYMGGLYRYNKENGKISAFREDDSRSISSDAVRDILVDRQGNLWLGTGMGLNYLSPEEKSSKSPVFKEFIYNPGDSSSIPHNYVLTLFESSVGEIWIGTMGGGLCKYLGEGKFMTLNQEDGLPNNVIKGIQEDLEGYLWVSSNKGLSKIDPISLDVSNFDLYDGLQDFEFGEHACLRLSDGEMIFGGVRGFNVFDPKDISIETSIPELVFTDFLVQNRSVSVGEEINGKVILDRVINETEKISLKYRENSFTIHFSGLHYSAPMKNQYKYMLKGFDKDWVKTDAGATFAKYNNLKPGLYTFKFMASNNDGVWNPVAKSLTIRVIPPSWLTMPAFLIYLAVFLILALFFNRYTFIRTKEKQDLIMNHFEQEKLRELSQMKLRFYTNISHEFRTPLTLIIGPVKTLMRQFESLSAEKIKQNHQTIHKNAGILLRLINQLMDFRKMEQDKMVLTASEGNFYLTAKEIFESFEELAYQKSIEYHFSSFSKEILLWYDYEKIEKILYNLLSNAFKYTQKEGQVSFRIDDYDDDFIEIKIEDSGVGISDSAKEHIFERFYRSKNIMDADVGSTGIGLSLTKGLVDLHHGEIECGSELGSGSTFFLRLRKGDSHLTEKDKVKDDQIVIRRKEHDQFIPEDFAAEIPPEEVIGPKAGFKLLIVEDNVDLRKYLQESFVTEFSVSVAEDGESALEQIRWFEPDLVISDIMMPNKDGFELCREIKNTEATSHIPVILLSAKSTEEAQIKGFSLGADAYVPKPFSFDILLAQVRAILRKRKESQQKFKENLEISPSEIAMTAMDEKFLSRTRGLVETNITDPEYSVNKLALEYGISQKLMNKKLKALTGLTAKSFIRSIKLKRAAQLLTTGRYSVSEVTYDVGFSDLKYFRTCFKEEFDVTPSEYKKLNTEN